MAKAVFVKMMYRVIDLTYLLLLKACATVSFQDKSPAAVVAGVIPHIYVQAAGNESQLSHTSVSCYGSCFASWWPVSRQTEG
jgi:hypothetical protein